MPGLDATFGLITLYVATLLFSAISQFFVPAEAAMIPLLVRRDQLLAANSLFNLTFTAAQLVGFAFLGPLVVGMTGYKWLYIAVFGAYALCGYLTWRLPEKEEPGAYTVRDTGPWRARVGMAWAEFQEGWRFIRADAGLMTAIIYWSVANSLFVMLGAIGVKFVTNVLHISPDRLYVVMVPGGAGLLLGVLVVGRFSTAKNRTAMLTISLLLAGVGLLLLGLVQPVLEFMAGLWGLAAPPVLVSQVVVGVIVFGLGIVNSFITVPAQTVLQERSNEENPRPRVRHVLHPLQRDPDCAGPVRGGDGRRFSARRKPS